MSKVSTRHMRMLSMIPRSPRKITVADLRRHLESEQIVITQRTIQRDLLELAEQLPLISDEGKAVGWSWKKDAPQSWLPRVSPESALTYELLARFASAVMPRTLLKQLEPQFAQARDELDRLPHSGPTRWAKRIAMVPPTFSLLPPHLDPVVVEVVYEALLWSRRFEVDYRALGADRAKRWTINPLGLVQSGSVIYLVATLFDYDDIKHLPLHRMRNASMLDEPVRTPTGFDLQRHVLTRKEFEMPSGRTMRVKLDVRGWLPDLLAEQRLSGDQVIKPLRGRGGWHRVTASVMESELLFRWLCGHGANVRVVAPVALRRRVLDEHRRVATAYAELTRA